MAYTPRSSFVPKGSVSAIPAQVKKKRTIRIAGSLSVIMVIGSLVATISSFLYEEYLLKQLTNANVELQQQSNIDNEKTIDEIRQYDEKLRIARQLLDTHIAPSLIFEKLEESTKETVQFTSFEYAYDPGFNATLEVQGVTEEFASVALQKMQFNDDVIFSTFVLDDISLTSGKEADAKASIQSSGKKIVGFTVSGLFNKDELLFKGTEPDPVVPEVDVADTTSEPTDLMASTTTATSTVEEGTISNDIPS